MAYRIEMKPGAERALSRLPRDTAQRVDAAILILGGGCAAMTRESADRVLRDADGTLGKLRGGHPMVLERKGRERAVLMSARRFRSLLERLEDLEDAAEADRVLADVKAGRERTYSWEEVKRELGLE